MTLVEDHETALQTTNELSPVIKTTPFTTVTCGHRLVGAFILKKGIKPTTVVYLKTKVLCT